MITSIFKKKKCLYGEVIAFVILFNEEMKAVYPQLYNESRKMLSVMTYD